MKRVLGGVRCNTSSARLIGEADGVKLYKTKSRKFFVEDLAVADVYLISDADARQWLTRHFGAAKAEAAFAEDDPRKISLDLPEELLAKVDALRDGVRRSRAAVIKNILENALQ